MFHLLMRFGDARYRCAVSTRSGGPVPVYREAVADANGHRHGRPVPRSSRIHGAVASGNVRIDQGVFLDYLVGARVPPPGIREPAMSSNPFPASDPSSSPATIPMKFEIVVIP